MKARQGEKFMLTLPIFINIFRIVLSVKHIL